MMRLALGLCWYQLLQHEPHCACRKDDEGLGNLPHLGQKEKRDQANDNGGQVDQRAPSENVGGARDCAGETEDPSAVDCGGCLMPGVIVRDGTTPSPLSPRLERSVNLWDIRSDQFACRSGHRALESRHRLDGGSLNETHSVGLSRSHNLTTPSKEPLASRLLSGL